MEFCHAERQLAAAMGCRKLWMIFSREHWAVSRRIFEDVLRAYGLMLRAKRRTVRTTNSMHGLPVYPNLVYSIIPQRPCQIWVADITYISLKNADGTGRFCYLSIVMDAYSRYIMGYYVGGTLDTVYTSVALVMALETSARLHIDTTGLIHHSDRGVQYASAEYVRLLTENKIRISMTEDGDPKGNARAERINSTVKNELLKGMKFTSIGQVREELERRVPYYNNRRPHMSLSYYTPAEAMGQQSVIKKKWHSYRGRGDPEGGGEKNEGICSDMTENVYLCFRAFPGGVSLRPAACGQPLPDQTNQPLLGGST